MTHYLDFAATSALRPVEVIHAVTRYLEECGATPGRGGHARAVEAGRLALRCRRAVLEVLGSPDEDPGQLVFTLNATHALNLALSGVLAPGDAVVTTPFDHNATVRPLHALAERRGLELRPVPGGPDGSLDEDAFARAAEGARMVVLTAACNVLGTALPVGRLAAVARERGALVLVDAAQSAGHLEQGLDQADLVAVTGHKSLLGPQGIGALRVRPGLELEPLLRGGTGGNSLDPRMPELMPDRLEAGTLNGPGIAGLEAGCRWLLERGVDRIHRRVSALKARLRAGLADLPAVRVLSPPAPDGAGIVTLVADGTDPGTLARRLEREHGVQARSGLHCAPGQHRLLGTEATGALRLSLGWASTEADVDAAIRGMAELTATPVHPSS